MAKNWIQFFYIGLKRAANLFCFTVKRLKIELEYEGSTWKGRKRGSGSEIEQRKVKDES